MNIKNYQSTDRIKEKIESLDFGEDIRSCLVSDISIERDYTGCSRWLRVSVDFTLIRED